MTSALLISNVVALACAVAEKVHFDCETEMPAHCVEMLEFDGTVGLESSGKESRGDPPTNSIYVLPTYATLQIAPALHEKLAATIPRAPPTRLYAINCTYLI